MRGSLGLRRMKAAVCAAIVFAMMSIALGTGDALRVAEGQEASTGSVSVPKPRTNDEMVLLSFEKEELQGVAKGIRELGSDRSAYAVSMASKKGGGLSHQWFRIRKGDATRGEWAFFRPVPKRWTPGYYSPLLDWRNQRGAVGSRNRDILNTGPGPGGKCWLARLPGGGDWSGYDMVRLDVKCTSAAVVRLDIEDEEIVPAVKRRFTIPGRKWITVELDLRKAVEARGLDPSKMANFCVFVEQVAKTAETATVFLDNLRLVKEGVKPELPLIVDETPYTTEPRVYAIAPIEKENNRYGQWKVLEYPEKDQPVPTKRDLDLPKDRGPWRFDMAEKRKT